MPAAHPPIYQVPLVADGQRVGVLVAGPKRHDVELLPEDQSLLATVAPLVATALQNARLIEQIEGHVATLAEREQALAALSRRLMSAQEDERQRLALDLHDDPLQRAILVARELDGVGPVTEPERLRADVEDIVVSLRAIATGLRPPALDDLGLAAALEGLLNELRARSGATFTLRVEPEDVAFSPPPDADLALALYRAAQEALNNCLKHAHASQVTVTLRHASDRVVLQVVDDGQGLSADPAGDHDSLGLLGMRERLRPWGGVVSLVSGSRAGAVLTVEVLVEGARDG